MKLFILIAIFLLIGGYIIVKANTLDLSNADDRETFAGKFLIWLKGVGKNTADVAGYAAQKDWLPADGNNTNTTNNTQLN